MKVTVRKVVDIEVEMEDLTDQELLDECDRRGISTPELDLSDFDNDDIRREYQERFEIGDENRTLELIYEEFRTRGDAPRSLRDFLYERIGRIL